MTNVPASAALRAILLALGAYASFSIMDTLVKLLSAHFHPVQIACFVAAAGLLPPLLSALIRRDPRALSSRAPRLQLLRGVLMLLGGVAAFASYSLLPLADAYAVGFTQPLIVIALAWPVLGERVGARRWAAVVVSFIGVLIVLRPGAGAFAPSGGELGLFLVAGLLGGSSFLILAYALKLAPAASIAPFQYSQMTYAILVGIFVFGDLPDPLTLLGAAVIIASGLFVLRQETSSRAAAPAVVKASARLP